MSKYLTCLEPLTPEVRGTFYNRELLQLPLSTIIFVDPWCQHQMQRLWLRFEVCCSLNTGLFRHLGFPFFSSSSAPRINRLHLILRCSAAQVTCTCVPKSLNAESSSTRLLEICILSRSCIKFVSFSNWQVLCSGSAITVWVLFNSSYWTPLQNLAVFDKEHLTSCTQTSSIPELFVSILLQLS